MKDDVIELSEESKIGKKLTDKITRKTIILVLSFIIALIFFNTSFYLVKSSSMEIGLKLFNEFQSVDDPNLEKMIDVYIKQFEVIII